MADTASSKPASGSATPNEQRFQSQGHTAEDLLKEQTYGLVTLSDFRKRRAEAVEQSERSQDGTPVPSDADGREPAATAPASASAVFKKRKKGPGSGSGVKKGGLSFAQDDDDEDEAAAGATTATAPPADTDDSTRPAPSLKKRLQPNAAVTGRHAPKALTKSALLKESQVREQLRREYLQMQEAVKATDLILPFTFFAGKTLPGGKCRVKKGDHVWLFLERARKVGADMAGRGDRSKKDWARISVDDLMLVKGDLIIPHHYDFHHFILNKTRGYDQQPLFSYSAEPTAATPAHLLPASSQSGPATPSAPPESTPDPAPAATEPPLPTGLSTAAGRAAARATSQAQQIPDADIEGYDHDPSATKVVDRRWYERNKHIYPASMWEEFDAEKDYAASGRVRKDRDGNVVFFSQR